MSHLNRILDYYIIQGYDTALDDIGSGYSDISALLKLKPDYMKIDMEIVCDIHLDIEKQKQLDEFISNGKEIGLTILAEGVEKVEEYNYLISKKKWILCRDLYLENRKKFRSRRYPYRNSHNKQDSLDYESISLQGECFFCLKKILLNS